MRTIKVLETTGGMDFLEIEAEEGEYCDGTDISLFNLEFDECFPASCIMRHGKTENDAISFVLDAKDGDKSVWFRIEGDTWRSMLETYMKATGERLIKQKEIDDIMKTASERIRNAEEEAREWKRKFRQKQTKKRKK